MKEFINLNQGSMTVREYCLKFFKLSWYATSLVSNCMDQMSKFLKVINGDLEECRSVMLHEKMDLLRLMVHIHKVEDSHKKRGIRDARRHNPQDQEGPGHGEFREL